MRILLDDQPCPTDAVTIGEAIDGAAALAGERGRIVIEVTVDGAPWGDEELASIARRAEPAGEVSMVSANLEDLVCRALDDASAALRRADEMQREAAELLQADRRTEAMERLGAAIEIWRSVHLTVAHSAEAARIDLTALRVGDAPLTDAIPRLSVQLDAMRSALEGDDPVGLSDTLLYDLPDVVAEWREVLHVIRAYVEDGPPRASRGADGE